MHGTLKNEAVKIPPPQLASKVGVTAGRQPVASHWMQFKDLPMQLF